MPPFDIRIHLPNMGTYRRLMAAASPEARHAVAIQIAKDTEPFVPARTKLLSNRVQVKDDTIIYPGPYARFLWHGKVMVDPATGSPYARFGAHKVVTGRTLNIRKTVHPAATMKWYEYSKQKNLEKWRRVMVRSVNSRLNGNP